MFEKLVAIEPVSLIPSAEKELFQYAKEVVLYDDIPADDEEPRGGRGLKYYPGL